MLLRISGVSGLVVLGILIGTESRGRGYIHVFIAGVSCLG